MNCPQIKKMYFLKNESNSGGDCLCTSGNYDPEKPTEKYSFMAAATPARYKMASENRPYKQASAYLKQQQPATYSRQPAACSIPARQPAACSVMSPPVPARRPAACSVMSRQPAACSIQQPASYYSKPYRTRQPPRRTAMLREPVSSMRRRPALYEETESSRPFDYQVDYGNAFGGTTGGGGGGEFGGYSGTGQDSSPPSPPTIPSADDLFFNPGTVDQTSAQYKEALRLYYDKLGYPNFSPKNGYDYGVEYFDKSGLQSVPLKYGTISKF
jgi:hypothetical protein